MESGQAHTKRQVTVMGRQPQGAQLPGERGTQQPEARGVVHPEAGNSRQVAAAVPGEGRVGLMEEEEELQAELTATKREPQQMTEGHQLGQAELKEAKRRLRFYAGMEEGASRQRRRG